MYRTLSSGPALQDSKSVAYGVPITESGFDMGSNGTGPVSHRLILRNKPQPVWQEAPP